MRNANEKKEEEGEMMLNWLESGEFSFVHVNRDIPIVMSYSTPSRMVNIGTKVIDSMIF